MFDGATQDILFIRKIKWVIQLPFIGSVLSKKKLHGDKAVTMQLVGLVKFVSSDKYHSFGGIPWGIPNPASIPSNFFLHRRTAPT